jgi:hypothetical protein
MGPTALVPLRRKACCGFLSLLKIHCPRPGLNSWTLGPMTVTLTTRPPRAACWILCLLLYFIDITKGNVPFELCLWTHCVTILILGVYSIHLGECHLMWKPIVLQGANEMIIRRSIFLAECRIYTHRMTPLLRETEWKRECVHPYRQNRLLWRFGRVENRRWLFTFLGTVKRLNRMEELPPDVFMQAVHVYFAALTIRSSS